MFKRCFLIFSLLIGTLSPFLAQNQFHSASSLLIQTHKAIENTHTMSYRSTVWERLMDGSFNESEMVTKVQNFPYKVYMYNIAPTKGVELLYDTETDNRKVLVNPNGFPWMNVRLDIHSKIMRNGKHQTVERAGLRFIGDILMTTEQRLQKEGKFDQSCTYKGQVQFEGQACHVIEMMDPDYHFLPYVVQEGEDIIQIARRFRINEYKVLELNPKVKHYTDVKAGDEIQLTSSYGKKTLIYLYPQSYLVAQVEIFDEKGKFERYSYLDIKVNPSFAPDEFSETYPAYGF